MDEKVLDAKPVEIIKGEYLEIEIYKKKEGPWPFSKDDCLFCEDDMTHYAYFNDGRNVVRRFCDSEECKKRAISGVEESVSGGSIVNPAYFGINNTGLLRKF